MLNCSFGPFGNRKRTCESGRYFLFQISIFFLKIYMDPRYSQANAPDAFNAYHLYGNYGIGDEL